MGQNVRHTVDTALALKASGAVTSSAAGATILDLGSGEVRGDLIIDVTAMDIASNDEVYDVILQGSPDADFGAAGNIQELQAINLSAKEVKRSDSDKDDATGLYVKPFSNSHGGTTYRYLRIYTVVAGTTPSITYSARLAKV